MKYVLSDIHGNKTAWDAMLRKINLQPEDTLYILGDVIDRHPDGIAILKQIMAMPNAKMLLGNHEYMMLQTCQTINGEDVIVHDAYDLWCGRNGGYPTIMAFGEEPEEMQHKILDFLKGLPLEYWDGTPDGTKVQMVHACPKEYYPKHGKLYKNETEFCVWDREAIMEEVLAKELDHCVIFGHTPTDHFQQTNDHKLHIAQEGSGIGIDCGAGWPNNCRTEGRLCCLRLDDGHVFYTSSNTRLKRKVRTH